MNMASIVVKNAALDASCLNAEEKKADISQDAQEDW